MPEQIITSEKEDMALKLSLEAGLIPPLGRLFKQISQDYKTVYSATGQILNAAIYQPELIGILRPAYRKAAKKSGREIRSKFEIVTSTEDRVGGLVDVSLLNFSEKESLERSNIITATSNRWLNDFTLQEIIGKILAGSYPNNQEVANVVSNRFTQRSKGRSKNIAVTETLNAVDGARLIEANVLLQADAWIKAKSQVKAKIDEAKRLIEVLFRRWKTREDEFVRPTHVIANGQTVQGTMEPFRVGNSLLMYPGDTSLGALIEEISGCRCFSEIFIR
jgi:hypothetical protein